MLDDEQRARVAALATDFPKLWREVRTPDRERKRMAQLLIEDVTLSKGAEVLAQVRFKGGARRELSLPLPRNAWQLRRTEAAVVAAPAANATTASDARPLMKLLSDFVTQ